MKELIKTVFGICLWIAIGYGAYSIFIKESASPSDFTQEDFEAPLSTYRTSDKSTRDAMVEALVLNQELDSNDLPHFIDCMGEFAVTKLETLAISEVFGWCAEESVDNRERFVGHYNEIEAKDEPRHAVAACEAFMEDELLAPSTAEHPTGGQQYFDHGKGRYTITTYVDAQNGFGAMIRNNYQCVVEYVGPDAPWHSSGWLAESIALLP